MIATAISTVMVGIIVGTTAKALRKTDPVLQ